MYTGESSGILWRWHRRCLLWAGKLIPARDAPLPARGAGTATVCSHNASAPCQRQPQAFLCHPVPPAPLCGSRPLDSHQPYSLAGRAGIYLLQALESGLHFKLDSKRHFIISDKSQSVRGLPIPLMHSWLTNEPAQQHTNP